MERGGHPVQATPFDEEESREEAFDELNPFTDSHE
jgi:hypothetical protein